MNSAGYEGPKLPIWVVLPPGRGTGYVFYICDTSSRTTLGNQVCQLLYRNRVIIENISPPSSTLNRLPTDQAGSIYLPSSMSVAARTLARCVQI